MGRSLTSFTAGNQANHSLFTREQHPLFNEKTQTALEALTPVTQPTYDLEGCIIQIWKYYNIFLGAILDKNGHITIVPRSHIHNGLQPDETENSFLDRIAALPSKKWGLVALTNRHIVVWPHLEAAGRPGPDLSPAVVKKDGGHIYRHSKKGGHIPDTKENRELLIRTGSDYRNWVGTNRHGQDVFFKIQEDGSQVWVYRRDNVIENGGVNLKGQHSVFVNGTVNHKGWGARFNEGSRVVERHDKLPARIHNLTIREGFQGGGGPSSGPGGGPRGPGGRHFQQLLQQTKLTESYNSTNRGNPIPAKGGTGGTIGGVACGVDYIEGLFDGVESVFGKDHYFCVPLIDGQIPFSQEQLRQILRELAIGIYAHGTVPFFSLHFNQNGDLFPVIHPAYQNTLVGRVIGMLDYFMKGYLNGGVFSEEDIDNWNKPEESQPSSLLGTIYNWWNPNQASSSGSKRPLDKLIDFEEYCKEHLQGKDKKYLSVKSIQKELEMKNMKEGVTAAQESRELSDFEGFKNSFRIIAKQNSFQKEDNLFVIDADFDVLYTIEPSPMYQEKLEEYIREHGKMPTSYINLIAIYESMGKRIHDHMVKMPMCREYFSMLGAINFFSSYFSTLKKHRKIPELSTFERIDTRGCPPLFPHLPLTVLSKEVIQINDYAVIKNSLAVLTFEEISMIIPHVRKKKPLESFDRTRINEVFLQETESNILELSSAAFKRYLLRDKKLFNTACERAAKELVESVLRSFEQILTVYYQFPQARSLDERSLIHGVFASICKRTPNQAKNFSRPITYNNLSAPNQVYAEDLEKNKNIVGGCGMRLEKKKIQSSSKASFVLENNHLPLDPETWEKVHMGDKEGAVFRLPLEDIPSGMTDDYSWMESLLLEERDPEVMQSWVEIQQAMELGDYEEFEGCIKRVKDLTKIKGPNKASLLHLAAKYHNAFYVCSLYERSYLTQTDTSRNILPSDVYDPGLAKYFTGALSVGIPMQSKDANGYLPIHYAAMTGAVQSLEILLKRDPSTLDAISVHGASPLITAIQHNQEKTVEVLLKNKPKAALLTGGYTDLHCALHEGNIPIINMVLASPIALSCINVCSEEGGTPIYRDSKSTTRKNRYCCKTQISRDAKSIMEKNRYYCSCLASNSRARNGRNTRSSFTKSRRCF